MRPVTRTRKAHGTNDQSIHGTCVAMGNRGVLIRGRSGVGKSDLALRLIAEGARLIADDQVLVGVVAGRLVARAPEPIRGLIEVRGVGLVPAPTVASARIDLVVDLVASRAVPRLPEVQSTRIHGVDIPAAMLAPFEASAAIKVRLALRFGAGCTASPREARSRPKRTPRS
jgi:serine kinase of HPr protein (carbohydrate metabolism regulator)